MKKYSDLTPAEKAAMYAAMDKFFEGIWKYPPEDVQNAFIDGWLSKMQ